MAGIAVPCPVDKFDSWNLPQLDPIVQYLAGMAASYVHSFQGCKVPLEILLFKPCTTKKLAAPESKLSSKA